MDRPQWPQEIVVKPMEEILVPNTPLSNSNNNSNSNPSKPSSSSSSFERRPARPQKAAAVNCPRCDSRNTKFCYYNNYSLSQPRYFCKTCRRYWTEGGTLRNIPVGGGSRKNKRSSSYSSSSTSSSYSSVSKTTLPDLVLPSVLSQNPKIHPNQYGQDLNLGFLQPPNFDAIKNTNSSVSTTTTTTTTTTPNQISALELLTGITSRGMRNSFIPVLDPNSVYTPAEQLMIPMPEFKIPSLSFSLDGMESGNGGRVLYPFEELKTNTSADNDDDPGEQNKDQNSDSNGFWNGMMGGGSW